MRKILTAFALVLGFGLAGVTAAEDATGVVKNVVDATTIQMEDGQIVRYIGICVPELSHIGREGDSFGQEAAEANRKLVLGKKVRIETDVEIWDAEGRTLAYVYVGDIMANVSLVKDGYAQVMPMPPNLKHQNLLMKNQIDAQTAKAGFWGKMNPLMNADTVSPYSSGKTPPKDKVVYVTRTSRYYHRAGCKDLEGGRGGFPLPPAKAKEKGFSPCPLCDPPD